MDKNIGFVKYKKDLETGNLDAIWGYMLNEEYFSGTGIAQGTNLSDFLGEYEITYYTNNSESISVWKLIIKKIDDKSVELTWCDKKGNVGCIGIGYIEGCDLFAGWKAVI